MGLRTDEPSDSDTSIITLFDEADDPDSITMLEAAIENDVIRVKKEYPRPEGSDQWTVSEVNTDELLNALLKTYQPGRAMGVTTTEYPNIVFEYACAMGEPVRGSWK